MTDPTATGLYPRIKAVIEEQLRLSREAAKPQTVTPSNGYTWAWEPRFQKVETYAINQHPPIPFNSYLAYVIRQLEADLARLTEHESCAAAYTVSLGRLGCEEIARLVHAYEVEVTP